MTPIAAHIQYLRNIKGYSDEVEYGDDAVIETVIIDYDEVNIDEVKNLQGA